MTREDLLVLAAPILERLRTLHADDPAGSTEALSRLDLSAFEAGLRQAHAEGRATPREGGGVRFGRLAKPSPQTFGFSIDVVDMAGPAAGAHTHLTGEFDFCLALEGNPRFDGRGDRWVVYPPGSRHVPTVTGGRMLIAYFVLDGAIRFEG